MKRVLFTILCLFTGYAACGQDLIVIISGDSLNCKITEVKTDAIFFRYDVGGNIVSLPMNQVASYKYDFYKNKRGTSAISVSMRGRSELSVYAGGGVSNFIYEQKQGPLHAGVGWLFGIGYTWFVSGRWGIVTGLEASQYRAEYVSDGNHKGSGMMEGFEFHYDYQNYSEKQSALFLQIPAMLQFQTGRFFASAGLKIGIPVSIKYDVTCTNFSTWGEWNNQPIPNDKDNGLYDFGATSYSGNSDSRVLVAAAFEVGGQWFLGKRTNLYAGVWFDIVQNNLSKNKGTEPKDHIVEYDSKVPGRLKYYSVLDTNSKFSAGTVGLKVKLTFSL